MMWGYIHWQLIGEQKSGNNAIAIDISQIAHCWLLVAHFLRLIDQIFDVSAFDLRRCETLIANWDDVGRLHAQVGQKILENGDSALLFRIPGE